MSAYRTAPDHSTTMPSGIPYIVGNEAAERFSYYGMKSILVIFMTQYLLNANGSLAPMSKEDATFWYHIFSASVYVFPFLGAIAADWLFGKYRVILGLSIVYCLGHLALAVDETRLGLALGLGLIAIGSGGIKPCVSAHVGDQFGPGNQHLLSKVFGWFYFSINLGSCTSMLLIPKLLADERFGPKWAFGIPGVLMFIATVVFWMGRKKFVHIPPGGAEFGREIFGSDGLRAILNLVPLYLFVSMFWSLFDQTGSAWVLQATEMNRNFLGYEWLPSQVQALNPVLVMLFIPLFTYVIYPAMGPKFTPLRRVGTGFFLTTIAFAITGLAQIEIDQGDSPSIAWQFVAYIVLTAGEILVSITCLEFSYTQAPRRMKSLVMGLFFLSVASGNMFTAIVNKIIPNADGTSKLEGAQYYWFFSGTMLLTLLGFAVFSQFYRGSVYIQKPED